MIVDVIAKSVAKVLSVLIALGVVKAAASRLCVCLVKVSNVNGVSNSCVMDVLFF